MGKNKPFFEAVEHFTIKNLLNYSAEKYSNNIAFVKKVVEEGEKKYKNITYSELKKDVDAFGNKIASEKMEDRRIAVIGNNSYEWAVVFLSCPSGISLTIPLDKGLTKEELESCLIRSKADTIVFDKSVLENVEFVKENKQTFLKKYICIDKTENYEYFYDYIDEGNRLFKEGKDYFTNVEVDPDKLAILLFTSGTTSKSKAVMLTNRNLTSNVYAMNLVEDIKQTDVNLAFIPYHHAFGCTAILVFLSCGAKTAFCDGLRHIPENLREYKVTVFVCVPLLIETMYKKVEKEVARQGKTKLIKTMRKVCNCLEKVGIKIRRKIFKPIIDNLGGHLRLFIVGAAPLDKKVAIAFNELGIETVQGYGLTETAPVIAAENFKRKRAGSCGFPMLNDEIKIINKNDEGIGEITVKGPNVMLGYYEDEEKTKEVLKDGWFHTGDLGYIDKEGYLFITGRKKDVIVLKNGKNVYPDEIECLINGIEGIKENMVFGFEQDDDLVVTAKVVYDEEVVKEKYPNSTIKELEKVFWEKIKEVNKKLPTYKYVKKMILTKDSLIKTTTAKVKRNIEIAKTMKEEKKKNK